MLSIPTDAQICSLCRERVGACIQCEKSTCFTAFHVTCARQMGFLTTMKSMGQQDGPLKAYCEKHLPVS
jgi:NuA3 HAT complex component NTO1